MSSFLEAREYLQKFYSQYSFYIEKIARFILGLLVFYQINSKIGYMEAASSGFVTFGLAVLCAFPPTMVMVLVASGLILAHMYALSVSLLAVVAVIFIVLYALFLRFSAKHAYLALIVPLAFVFNVPLLIPIAFGLIGVPAFIVPAVCGVIVFYLIDYIRTAVDITAGLDMQGMISEAVSILQGFLGNRDMWVMVVLMLLIIPFVFTLRRVAMQHAWKMASGVGALCAAMLVIIGNNVANASISVTMVLVNVILAVGFGLLLEFLFFHVNYRKTEQVQFEDNQYVYYVKAVPKIGKALNFESNQVTRDKKRTASGTPSVRTRAKRRPPVHKSSERRSHVDTASLSQEDQATTVIGTDQVRKLRDLEEKHSQRTTSQRSSNTQNPGRSKSRPHQDKTGRPKRPHASSQHRASSHVTHNNPDNILLTRSLTEELGLDREPKE